MSDGFVGREHKFLDQPVRDIALRARDAFHQPEFVEFDYGFGQIEINGAAAPSFAVQNQSEIAHHFEAGDQRRISIAQAGVALKNRVYIRVGHALGGTNHAFADFIAENFSAMVDLHHAGKHEPVEMRTQAANIGGKLERQHGDGAVGKVNAGAAQAGFLIECRARRDILGHVGDVDLQLKIAVFRFANCDRVVEVARRFAVDGDDRQIAEILAMVEFPGRNDGRNGLCLFERGGREMVRQMKFTNRDFDIDAEVIFAADNFNDSSLRNFCGRGPVGDFYIDHHAFQIAPAGGARGFIAKHAIDGSGFFLCPRCVL